MHKTICMHNENSFGMNYMLFCPDDCTELPLLVFLHGAGERGDKIDHLNRHAIPRLIEEGTEFPAVVLCPQCPAWAVWDNVVRDAKALIDSVVEKFEIQKDRICITGSSMGGFGTWMMGKTYPNFFSAIGPVAGGGMSWRTSNLCTTPVLAVHGAEDVIVPQLYSELMVNGVNASGGHAELISLPGLGHNDGIDYAYRNTKLIDWLLQQRRMDFTPVPDFCSEYF